MKKNILCEHGTYIKSGMEVKFICNITNSNCSFIRWCLTDNCLKMMPKYKECNGRNRCE